MNVYFDELYAIAVCGVDVSRSRVKSQHGGVRWAGLLYGLKSDSDHVESKTQSGLLLSKHL